MGGAQVQDQVSFACNMGALTAAQRTEHAEVMRALFSAVLSIRPIDHGYGLLLVGDDDVLGLLGRFIALERRCCPFFTFEVRVPPDAVPELAISGPPGVQPFIEAEFGALLPGSVRFPSASAQ